jgi:hypothetical protein
MGNKMGAGARALRVFAASGGSFRRSRAGSAGATVCMEAAATPVPAAAAGAAHLPAAAPCLGRCDDTAAWEDVTSTSVSVYGDALDVSASTIV